MREPVDTLSYSLVSIRHSALNSLYLFAPRQPRLSPGKIAAYKPVISTHLTTFLSALAEAQSASRDESTVNIAPYVHRFTFNAVIEIIYGEPVFFQPYTSSDGCRDVLTSFRHLSSLAWGVAYLPWLGWLMSTRAVVHLTRRPAYNTEGSVGNIAAACRVDS